MELENEFAKGFWDVNLQAEKMGGHVLKLDKNKIYIDDFLVGVGIAITTFCNIRGVTYKMGAEEVKMSAARRKELEQQVENYENFVKSKHADVDTIFFDEFEPLKPKLSSGDRFQGFLQVADTLFRFRDKVRVIACANLEKAFSPFLYEYGFGDVKNLKYGIKKSYTAPNMDGRIQPLAVWCHVRPSDHWKKARDESYVGKVVRGKDSGMFTTGQAYKGVEFNKFDKPVHRFIIYNLTDGENDLTYWKTREGIWYLTARTKNVRFPTYTFHLRNCNANVRLLPEGYKRQLLNAFEQNIIYFDSARSFEIFTNMIPNNQRRISQ